MPAFLIALLLFAGPARAADDAAAELARVQAADLRLRARAVDHSKAAKARSRAAEKATAADKRADAIPDSAEAKNAAAELAAAQARRELRKARGKADTTRKNFVGAGRGYIAAEDAYHAETGEYYNVWEYDRVLALLHRPPRQDAEVPDVGGGPEPLPPETPPGTQTPPPPPDGGNDPGGGDPGTPGDPSPPEDVLAQALAFNFHPGGAAAPARGPAPELTPAGADGSRAAAPDASAALSLDKGILLSHPAGGSAAPPRAAAEPERADGPRGALARAEDALRRNPRDGKAWAAKAAALNKLHRYKEAEEAAALAVRLDPGNAKAYRDLAWAQLHNGKADEALANATRMIFLDPENPEGYLLRAFAYEMKGDRARMLADLQRAAAIDPRYANHLARARAGLRLFDPNAPDTDSLLGALPPLPQPPSNALTWVGVLLVAAASLIGAALAVRTRLARPRPPAAAPSADAGLLGGKYRLGAAKGRVREAFDVTLERSVAVLEVAADPAARESRLAAARAASAVRHPNIAELYEVLEEPAGLALVFEWAPGKTLAETLAERRLTLAEAKAVLGPVCEALAYAHERGVAHGAVGPADITVSGDGRVKLVGLGAGAATPADDLAGLAACLRQMLAPSVAAEGLLSSPPADARAFLAALLAL
ncbi:hypothetical protein EPO15_02270 [bacterium]|nr:MAG: hypothetical protein EPO15_02270 [bacterium]